MDAAHFDALARSLTVAASRRTLLGSALGGLIAMGGLTASDARKKRKKKRKSKKGGKGKTSPDTDAPQTSACDGVYCPVGDRCVVGECVCDSSECAKQNGCCSAGHCVSGDSVDACGDKGDNCRFCPEKCEDKRCCLKHRSPCLLDRCCSGLVCKGEDHPTPACCHPDEAFCSGGDCCNKDCCGSQCCKDGEDCINGECKGKCLASQMSCGDSCCTPPDQCISGQCVGPCGSSAVRCGTAEPPRCCHSGTVCCESKEVCYTPGATNCPHTTPVHHIITVCPAVSGTGICCYKTAFNDVVECGYPEVCPDGYLSEPLFECSD